jgi:hypothetical protein
VRDAQLNAFQGSLALFGLPLTSAKLEKASDGSQVVTQWFERARFEWHPDKPREFRVLLGLLGNELQGQKPDGTSGIEGIVLLGPMCGGPVPSDNSCPDKPYQTTITVLGGQREQITQTQSDAAGLFRVPLAPGTYTLVPKVEGRYPTAGEQTVQVVAGQYTKVEIHYDTGIR